VRPPTLPALTRTRHTRETGGWASHEKPEIEQKNAGTSLAHHSLENVHRISGVTRKEEYTNAGQAVLIATRKQGVEEKKVLPIFSNVVENHKKTER